MKKWHIVAMAMVLAMDTATAVRATTQDQWKNFIEMVAAGGSAAATTAAGEWLPPGVSDVAGALGNSPDVVKAGLIFWLNSRIQAAEIADDWNRVDRYQAFLACISPNKDCSKVHDLTPVRGSDDFGGGSAGSDVDASGGSIQVSAGTYGGNCGVPHGNVTGDLAGACNGRRTCDYTVDYQKIGDPSFGCAKDYVAEWSCGGETRRTVVAPEAGYQGVAHLTCEAPSGSSGGEGFTISDPMVGDLPLDVCRIFENECGAPAADAYCKSRGYLSSSNHTEETVPMTRVIGDGRVCQPPHPCGRISSVTCR